MSSDSSLPLLEPLSEPLLSTRFRFLTFFVKTVWQSTVIVAAVGACWAVAAWVPFSLLMEVSPLDASSPLPPLQTLTFLVFPPFTVPQRNARTSSHPRRRASHLLARLPSAPSSRHSTSRPARSSGFHARKDVGCWDRQPTPDEHGCYRSQREDQPAQEETFDGRYDGARRRGRGQDEEREQRTCCWWNGAWSAQLGDRIPSVCGEFKDLLSLSLPDVRN